MSKILFSQLPPEARLWIFAAGRPVGPEEQATIIQSVETGLAEWSAHKSPVTWGHEIVYDQFLMIGVDEAAIALTGCSIDHAVHQIQVLEKELDLSFLDHSRIFFRDEQGIQVVDRPAFQEMVKTQRMTDETIVFNNVLTTIGEFRRGLWEVPARLSWHVRAFSFAS